MYEIRYKIKLNEENRPYIDLSEDYENNPEDKFFAMEVARYLLQVTFIKKENVFNKEFKKEFKKDCDTTISMIEMISDEVANIIFNTMKKAGDLDLLFEKQYYATFETLNELNDNEKYIIYDDKIFEKKEGLKVYIEEEETIYVYENNEWNKVLIN